MNARATTAAKLAETDSESHSQRRQNPEAIDLARPSENNDERAGRCIRGAVSTAAA